MPGSERQVGRGQLSAFELLPREADGILDWVVRMLTERRESQKTIYAEFVTRCEDLMADSAWDLEFDIPSPASFQRQAARQAQATRRIDDTREIAAALAERHGPKDADNLTVMVGELIKAAVLAQLDGVDMNTPPKDLLALATAARQAQQAQTTSATRLEKQEAREARQKNAATAKLNKAAKEAGLTPETAEFLRREVLGVGKK